MKNLQEVIEDLESDVTGFLDMCSKEDAEFITKSEQKKNAQTYARLCSVAIAFGLRGAMLRLLSDASECGMFNKVMRCLKKVKTDFAVVKKWVEDFIAKVPYKEVKDLCIEYWTAHSADIEKDCSKFDLSNFIKQ